MTSNFIKFNREANQLICQGDWTLANFPVLKNELESIHWPSSGSLTIDGKAIQQMDSACAWLLNYWLQKLKQKKIQVHLQNFSEEHQQLLALITKHPVSEKDIPEPEKVSVLAKLGKTTIHQLEEFTLYLEFIGRLTFEWLRMIAKPSHMRFGALTGVIEKTGLQALPIIALLSFMIGIVIAYQMGNQLLNYGANIFIVDLLGFSVLREFGPLLTAIMVAGRTGSAFTAQLGTMKINQEIDALNTMGVTPGELLLIPRIIGLTIALPLLTIWADMWGVIGGMVMANNLLNVSWHDFLNRFQHEIPLRALIIGLGKAPLFALIISSVGCFQGMQVSGSADSVGTRTTRSVVLAIFFIIITDAILSVIFSKFKL